MKVILSRKGFDSANGGMPSLIMPNGDLVSLPIPGDECSDKVEYVDLAYGSKSYRDILKDLRPHRHYKFCHCDPDLRDCRICRRPRAWSPAFGQANAAAAYLQRTVNVKCGDVFLFFGNFRAVEERKGRYRFVTRTGDFYRDHDLQLIWGYLQVGEILRSPDDNDRIKAEYPWHPHALPNRLGKDTNTLFVPTRELTFAPSVPGCGVLPFSRARVLTKEGANKATWKYDDAYAPESVITARSRKNMSDDGIYYAGIWQELGLKALASHSLTAFAMG